MARLNELPMSTDSIETLRNKFLRQNRDIARVNSAQSLRIRSLEGECGRLLSENLTLNGRILALERDLEELQEAQRIADHALGIKAKMESQLVEWGAMLAGLGVERAAKRHAPSSPGVKSVAGRRKSMIRSPAARQRPRDSRSSAEMAALQEGRLPPIQENITYPRRTMNHDEILAIRSEAADSNESPDLGPPPTSRFVEEPVKIDSPTRSTGISQPSLKLKVEAFLPSNSPTRPDLEPIKKNSTASVTTAHRDSKPAKPTRTQLPPPMKAGSKRKFGDENENIQLSRVFPKAEKTSREVAPDNPLIVTDLKSSWSVNDLPANFDEKNAQVKEPTTAGLRQPLADKNRNSGVNSPKKLLKSATTADLLNNTADLDRGVSLKAAPLKKKKVVPMKLPALPPKGPLTAKPPLEPVTPSADPGLVFPDTPETLSTSDKTRDTPPPADITSHGETSRPSRRVRADVSYAEPNLRCKMRRPTKEMLDAVSGEGKYKRTSSAHHLTSASASKLNGESELTGSATTNEPPAAEPADEEARRRSVISPLIQGEPLKDLAASDMAGNAVTERRRRPYSRQSQLFVQLEEADDNSDEDSGLEQKPDVDPYEFRDESSVIEQPKETVPKGRSTKGTRKSTAAINGGSNDQNVSLVDAKRPSRKRVSMAAPRKASMLEEAQDADSSYEASMEMAKVTSSALLQDKVSRRRSMML